MYPLMGITAFFHSKIKRDIVLIIGIFIILSVIFVGLFSFIFFDEENTFLWYCLTVLTIVFSSIVLLNASNNNTKILKPKTIKDYIINEKIEYFKNKTIRILLSARFAIYPLYIILAILNQLRALNIVSFSTDFSLYLQVNEYSLIILFTVNEMINFFQKH